MENKDKIMKVEEIITKLSNNDFNIYFFVIDSKGAPNGEVKYIYDIALSLYDLKYNVIMIHQEDEFVGPFEWLGEKYSVLKHKHVGKDNIVISASDFLFIPEVYSNIISQTKTLPCKRIVLYYNPEYLLEFMPVTATYNDMGIYDVVTTNTNMSLNIKTYFPNVNVRVIPPSIREFFKNTNVAKKMIVNILTPSGIETNSIVKPFYWKNPMYKWITFRDLKETAQEPLAEMMSEAAITVWVDDNTQNAQTALEALKAGSILIAKVPQTIPDWMIKNGELRDDVIWVDSYAMLHDVLSSVIRGWTKDEIVDRYLTVYETISNVFTIAQQNTAVKKEIIDGIFDDTIKSYNHILSGMKNKKENNEE